MATNIFVNLPVKDLDKSVEFFTKMGYTFNAQFTDQNATCMIVGDKIFVMLLVEKFFKTFLNKEVADSKKDSEVIIAISEDSREKVDELVNKARDAGAGFCKEPQDHGFMYSRSFQDPDGHVWEVLWMDPSAVNPG